MSIKTLLLSLQRSAFRAINSPQALGVRGERAAARYLRRQGYVIVAGGRRSRYGEIDLIAVWRKELVVFIEVKTRRSRRGGAPEEAVDLTRQRRLTRAGLEFLKSHGLLEYPARFDVVSILWPRDARRPESIEHFQDAFEPLETGQFFV